MKLVTIETAKALYYLQPDGTYKKGGDGRSKGLTKEELPEGAEIASSQSYRQIRDEGKTKGIDLPYEDEATQLLQELMAHSGTLADKAIEYYNAPERDRLRMLNNKKIIAPADDYYDLLLMSLCKPILQEEIRRLQQRAKFVAKLLK